MNNARHFDHIKHQNTLARLDEACERAAVMVDRADSAYRRAEMAVESRDTPVARRRLSEALACCNAVHARLDAAYAARSEYIDRADAERAFSEGGAERPAPGYAYCQTHGEFYETQYWSCCEKCWNERGAS
jgi:hypothetical protein